MKTMRTAIITGAVVLAIAAILVKGQPIPAVGAATPLPKRMNTREFIAIADQDRDGKISLPEVTEFVRTNFKLNYTKTMFDLLDLNHDGIHTVDEIQLAQNINDASIPVVFRTALRGDESAAMVEGGDADGDGVLTLTEAAAFLTGKGVKVVPLLLTRFDLTRDGALSADEIDAARRG